MNTHTLTKDNLAIGAPALPQPTIAVVFPFDPKMTPKARLELTVKRLLGAAEKELLARYPGKSALPVIKRLQQALRGLDYSTHRRSIAVWASARMLRTIYLEFAVEERMFVDQPFRVRDLADCKPSAKEYLLLLLSDHQSKTYLKNGNGLRLIKSNGPQNIKNFLQQMDYGLTHVLKAYPLPVFVAGTERVTGDFARLTQHTANIAGYVFKSWADLRESELETLLQPMLAGWRQLRQELLLLKLEKAAETGKLVCGIDEVRKAARCSNSRLVVVGKSTGFPTDLLADEALDHAVEKVLASGGDVEMLDAGLPGRFDPLALIRYY